MRVAVRRWAAWAPGLDRPEAWRRWCHAPTSLSAEGVPDVRFLPPLLRRRCSRLGRVMLHTAYAACEPEEPAALPTVFASRYGELGSTIALLRSLAGKEPLSASAFTHSVHNAAVGLFSIAAGNRHLASALAAGAATFPHAFIEGLAMMQRTGRAVLIVVGDEPLPTVFDAFRDEPPATYAVGLVIEPVNEGAGVEFGPAAPAPPASRRLWPEGVEFLRWLLSDEESLTLGEHRAWTWRRSRRRRSISRSGSHEPTNPP